MKTRKTDMPSEVHFKGNELAYLAGALARALPHAGKDFVVLDLLLGRLMKAMPQLDPDVFVVIEALREDGRRAYERLEDGASSYVPGSNLRH